MNRKEMEQKICKFVVKTTDWSFEDSLMFAQELVEEIGEWDKEEEKPSFKGVF